MITRRTFKLVRGVHQVTPSAFQVIIFDKDYEYVDVWTESELLYNYTAKPDFVFDIDSEKVISSMILTDEYLISAIRPDFVRQTVELDNGVMHDYTTVISVTSVFNGELESRFFDKDGFTKWFWSGKDKTLNSKSRVSYMKLYKNYD